jgi:hypothetical protein
MTPMARHTTGGWQGLWRRWVDSEEAIAEMERFVEQYGAAAEAYLNYPLQDPATPKARKRLLRAALKRLRWLKG